MEEGLLNVLKRHSPSELSSICGVLNLKSLQRGHQSIESIMAFAKKGHEITEKKLMQVLSCMWEGALLEYLASIGHPSSSLRTDPRETVMKIWREGGIKFCSYSFHPFSYYSLLIICQQE